MAHVRITKKFEFEMAHALLGYPGKCKHIHGHSYKLDITVVGPLIEDQSSPIRGMGMDFGDLKSIVTSTIVDIFNHALVVHKDASYGEALNEDSAYMHVIKVDYQPTCENMIVDFAERIQNELPDEINLFKIKLFETANSFAEYFPSDNQ